MMMMMMRGIVLVVALCMRRGPEGEVCFLLGPVTVT